MFRSPGKHIINNYSSDFKNRSSIWYQNFKKKFRIFIM